MMIASGNAILESEAGISGNSICCVTELNICVGFASHFQTSG